MTAKRRADSLLLVQPASVSGSTTDRRITDIVDKRTVMRKIGGRRKISFGRRRNGFPLADSRFR
ncbi:hypothetical protein LR032_02190 [Candidatus Bipolaricaulota bacterium]|nr:hypothetical protein [Candidatus Bipolaricaulota bacterium]